MEPCFRDGFGDWIVSATLAGANEIEIVTGLGKRLNAAGIKVARISVATDLLDPTFDGRGVRWLRDEGGIEETFARDEEGTIVTVDFPQSPFGASVVQEATMPSVSPKRMVSPTRSENATYSVMPWSWNRSSISNSPRL